MNLKTCYINGAWQAPLQATPWQLHNPADNSVLLNTQLAGEQDANAAVLAAAAAFPKWRDTPRQTRANYLHKLANALETHRHELAKMTTLNNGKILAEAEYDVADAIACYRYYADLITTLPECETLPCSIDNIDMLRCEEPLGVCALITPWNFPMVTTAWKLAPALAAGCTVVLKPSEFTLLPEMALGDILSEIHLPNGVANIIAGDASVGAALTTHPLVDKISFTGSNKVGETVMRQAATGIKNISLELGGKSAILITDDIDIETTIPWIINGFCFNAGQMCSATSRLLIPATLHDALIPPLIDAVKTLKTGDGLNPDNQLGAITTQNQYHTIQHYLQIAREEGLQCLTGGAALTGKGQFIPPTIYDNVPTNSRLWNEEIFGPVLLIRTYHDEAEAIQQANLGEYGLVGTIACKDRTRALHLARQIRAGHIWINSPQIVPPDAGWGGFKQSGIGRELGKDGLHAYLGSKHILMAQ